MFYRRQLAHLKASKGHALTLILDTSRQLYHFNCPQKLKDFFLTLCSNLKTLSVSKHQHYTVTFTYQNSSTRVRFNVYIISIFCSLIIKPKEVLLGLTKVPLVNTMHQHCGAHYSTMIRTLVSNNSIMT